MYALILRIVSIASQEVQCFAVHVHKNLRPLEDLSIERGNISLLDDHDRFARRNAHKALTVTRSKSQVTYGVFKQLRRVGLVLTNYQVSDREALIHAFLLIFHFVRIEILLNCILFFLITCKAFRILLLCKILFLYINKIYGRIELILI